MRGHLRTDAAYAGRGWNDRAGRLGGRFPRLVDKLARVQLLILDDWGTHTLTDQQRLHLLEIFEERYRRKSTLITAQLPVAQWHDMIGEPIIAEYPTS
nr:ATP-binding protein [Rhizobium sp. ACO-34A]